MFDWLASLSPDNQGKVITGVVGVGGTLLGALIGGAINWQLTRSTQRLQQMIADNAIANQKMLAASTLKAQERSAIDAMLIKMIEFMIAHPFVENTTTCHAYPNIGNANLNNGDNNKMRYEAYCIFVFNFLLRAFKHFDNDPIKLGDYIGLEEIVGQHYKWWQADHHNIGYDEPFRDCVRKVFEKMVTEGKIK